LITHLEENQKKSEEEVYLSNENKIYDVVSPLTLWFAISLRLFGKTLQNKKVYYLPQIVSEYMRERDMNTRELNVIKFLIEQFLKEKKSTKALKDIMLHMMKRVQAEIDFRASKQSMSDEIDVEPELFEISRLCQESEDRLKLFTQRVVKIEINKLVSSVSTVNDKKPRFTDVCIIGNDSDAEEVDDMSNEYLMADNENIYTQVYSDYVRQSFGASPLSKSILSSIDIIILMTNQT